MVHVVLWNSAKCIVVINSTVVAHNKNVVVVADPRPRREKVANNARPRNSTMHQSKTYKSSGNLARKARTIRQVRQKSWCIGNGKRISTSHCATKCGMLSQPAPKRGSGPKGNFSTSMRAKGAERPGNNVLIMADLSLNRPSDQSAGRKSASCEV